MSRLDELIKELCPDGVEFKRIKDVYTRLKGTPITAGKMKEIACDDGEIRIFAGGKTIIDAHEEDIPKANIIRVPAVLVQSRGVIDVIYYDKPFTFKSEMWAYTADDIISIKFLYYVLKNNIQIFRDAASGMGSLPQISLKVTEDFKLPVPPLEVQREIVRILDSFTLLTAELTAELTARKRQYEFYRDKLLTFDTSYPSGRIIDMLKQPITDGPHTTPKLVENGIPFLSAESVYDGHIHFEKKRGFITEEFDIECCKKYKPQKHDVFMVKSGSTTGKVGYVDTDERFNIWSPIAAMRVNENNSSRFLFHLLQSQSIQKQVAAKASHGSQPNLGMRALEQFKVTIPPLEVQKRIANVLDNFEAICSDLNIGLPAEIEARQKQYEYYRDLLLTFAETGGMLNRQTDRQTELSAIKLLQYVFGYAVASVGTLFEIKNGLNKEKSAFGKGKPIINFTDVYNHRYLEHSSIKGLVDVTDTEIERYSAKKGDVFFTRTSETKEDIGMSSTLIEDIPDCVFSGFVLRARPTTDYLLPKFCSYYFSTTAVRNVIIRYASVTTRATTTGPKLSKIMVPILPIEEQERIVSILDRFDTLCNDLSAGLPAEIEARQKQYEYYRDKLLSFEEKN